MDPRQTHYLNIPLVENRIRDLNLKKWWITEQIKIDRKTLSRWLNGHIRKVSHSNIEQLASVLQCTPKDLIVPEEVEIATSEDRLAAADLIHDKRLFELMQKTAQWRLLESIVKSTVDANCSRLRLGQLYEIIATTKVMLGDYEEAHEFAQKAWDIACEFDDRQLKVYTLTAFMLSYGNTEQYDKAHKYAEILRSLEPLLVEKTRMAARTNYASHLYDLGQYEEAIKTLVEPLEYYRRKRRNDSVCLCAYITAMSHQKQKRWDEARKWFNLTHKSAKRSGYTALNCEGLLGLCDLAILEKDHETASRHFKEATLLHRELDTPLNRYYEVKISWLDAQGKHPKALECLEEGLRLFSKRPKVCVELKRRAREMHKPTNQ